MERPGIYKVISPRTGEETYEVRIRRAGLRPFNRTFKTLDDAVAKYDAVRSLHAAGRGIEHSLASRISFRGVLQMYEDGTAGDISTVFEDAAFLDTALDALTPDYFAEWARTKEHPRDVLNTARDVLDYAMSIPEILLDSNVAATAIPLALPPKSRRISRPEQDLIAQAAGRAMQGRFRNFLCVAIETGIKLKDLVNLRAAEIHTQHNAVFIDGRVIPLSRSAMLAIKEITPGADGRLFPGANVVGVKKILSRLKESSHIVGFTYDDFRFEAYCRMLENGYSVNEVFKFSGLSQIAPIERAWSVVKDTI